jgi:hypothetical protein
MPAVLHGHNHVPDPIALVLAQARGGVAPSRHEVALSDYLVEQMRHREWGSHDPRIPQLSQILWRLFGRGTDLLGPVPGQSKAATKLWQGVSLDV